ncbi:RING finger protein 37-like [Babylonia areolata]|uniref:RING finger protein 37-like n=1 Tax=Babylonia areolata TaxID=304850 RepID=UPI003FD47972
MLVNFALECLGTEVSSDKVSRDGYEPGNLLCHSGAAWNRPGFLAESFIKPPVTLTFKLPCPVNLQSIILDPKVGTQRSSSVEIFSAADCKIRKPVSASGAQQPAHNSQNGNEAGLMQTGSSVFKKIGSIHCLEPGQICFFNPRFNISPSPAVDRSPESYQHRSELRHYQAAMLTAVDLLAVRIVGTANSSVAAIARLEIWGVPARACPLKLRQDVIQKYTSAMHSGSGSNHQMTCNMSGNVNRSVETLNGKDHRKQGEHAQNTSHDTQQATCSSLSASQTSAVNSVNIPEEFLDTLTFEIMSMPMLLPSGQCIDLSTLDRFSETEANYGRQPSDPFTGLTFTATRKPVVNTALKVRIDYFLVKHADDPSLHHVPRVLGHAQKPCDPSDSCHSHSAAEDMPLYVRNGASNGGSSARNLKRTVETSSQHNPQTRSHLPVAGNFISKYSPSPRTFIPASKRMKTETGVYTNQTKASSSVRDGQTSQPGANHDTTESHEERLRSSLLSSLASVLGKLPSFSNTSPGTSEVATPPSASLTPAGDRCSKCQTLLKQAEVVVRPREPVVVYKFPCQHLVCRACLVFAGCGGGVSTDVTCSVCCQQFPRGDVVRTHV